MEIQVALFAPFLVLRAKETCSAVCRRRRKCDARYRARRGGRTLYYTVSFPMGYLDLGPLAPHVVLTA